MKLNLLPTHVGRARSARFAIFLMLAMIAASAAASVFMVRRSADDLVKVKQQATDARKVVDEISAYASQAEGIIAQAAPISRNIALAQAMGEHNAVYPEFYKERVFKVVPGFYRITSANAVANGPDSVTVTLNGVLRGYQQYNDLLLAAMRIPGATNVQRSGYSLQPRPFLTGINRENKVGRLVDPTKPSLPENPLERLNALIARGGVEGFNGQGGFGSGTPGLRGPMPEYSQVTLSFVLPGVDLTTPNPRATLGVASSGDGGGGGGAGRPGGRGGRRGGGGGAAAAG